ncbi:MAG TPA: response regulator [Rhizomicrobium sp.]|nr:response regulator [Rhizomicrobium sp.]
MNFFQRESAAQSNFHCSRSSPDENPRRGSAPNTRLAGARVLIVEDEFIIALEIQANLEEAGATVIGPAYTLEQALELAEREQLSAAMLDLRLGRDSASLVAQLLHERQIPFLFYTGQPPSDPIRRAWPESTTLSKPASSDEIVHAVADIIRTTH